MAVAVVTALQSQQWIGGEQSVPIAIRQLLDYLRYHCLFYDGNDFGAPGDPRDVDRVEVIDDLPNLAWVDYAGQRSTL